MALCASVQAFTDSSPFIMLSTAEYVTNHRTLPSIFVIKHC